MSARGLPEPNSDPTTCFSIRVRSSRLMFADVSKAGWMLVTTTRPRSGGDGQRRGQQLTAADPHRQDDLVGHPVPTMTRRSPVAHPRATRPCASPELLRLGTLELDGVDRPDLLGSGEPGTLHGVDTDSADPHDGHDVTGSDLGGVDAGAPPGDDTAAQEARSVEGHVLVDLDAAGLVDDGVVGERAEDAHDSEVLALGVMARGTVELQAESDQRTEITQVLVSRRTTGTPATRRDEAEHDVVAGGQPADPLADLGDDASTFVTTDDRQVERQVTGDEVLVGVTQTRGRQLDENFAGSRWVELDLFHAPRRPELPQDRCLCLHHIPHRDVEVLTRP